MSGRSCYVITGPPGSGKTPVLKELVALGCRGVPEAAREVIAEQRAVDGQGVYDRDRRLFVELMLQRCVADLVAASSNEDPAFFDRGIPDLVGYCEIFDLDPSDAREAAKRHRYNDVVFAMPPWPEIYTTDDERRMTFEAAAAFGRRVYEVYVELGYTMVDVARATPLERAGFIREQVLAGERVTDR